MIETLIKVLVSKVHISLRLNSGYRSINEITLIWLCDCSFPDSSVTSSSSRKLPTCGFLCHPDGLGGGHQRSLSNICNDLVTKSSFRQASKNSSIVIMPSWLRSSLRNTRSTLKFTVKYENFIQISLHYTFVPLIFY